MDFVVAHFKLDVKQRLALKKAGYAVIEEKNIISYLLGQASEAEQRQIEDRYFQDPEFHEKVLASEEELIRQYLHGQLESKQGRLFEARLVSSQWLRGKYEFTKALIAKADEVVASQVIVESEPTGWRNWLTIFQPKLVWVAACALIVILGGTWWLANQSNSSRKQRDDMAVNQTPTPESPVQSESPKPPRAAASPTSEPVKPKPRELSLARVFAFTLPAIERDFNNPVKIQIPSGCEFIEMRAPLPLGAGNAQGYDVSVKRLDGEKIASLKNLKTRKSGGNQFVLLTLPVSLMKDGEYAISLNATTKAGESKMLSETLLEVKNN